MNEDSLYGTDEYTMLQCTYHVHFLLIYYLLAGSLSNDPFPE